MPQEGGSPRGPQPTECHNSFTTCGGQGNCQSKSPRFPKTTKTSHRMEGGKGFWGLRRPNTIATGFTLEACPRAWGLHEPRGRKHWDRASSRHRPACSCSSPPPAVVPLPRPLDSCSAQQALPWGPACLGANKELPGASNLDPRQASLSHPGVIPKPRRGTRANSLKAYLHGLVHLQVLQRWVQRGHGCSLEHPAGHRAGC